MMGIYQGALKINTIDKCSRNHSNRIKAHIDTLLFSGDLTRLNDIKLPEAVDECRTPAGLRKDTICCMSGTNLKLQDLPQRERKWAYCGYQAFVIPVTAAGP